MYKNQHEYWLSNKHIINCENIYIAVHVYIYIYIYTMYI